jgi:hypothetical protein
MTLFDDVTGGEILLRQSNLKVDLMSHQAYNLINMYCYTEDGDEGSSSTDSAKKSLGSTIIAKIRQILQNIKDMIKLFKANISKNKLTESQYMNSDTARLEIQLNVQEMQKEIDEEYLAARKIVSKIAAATSFPAKDVAAFCDNIQEKIHNNRDKVIPVGKAIVSTAIINSARNKAYQKINDSEKIVEDANKLLDKYAAEEQSTLRGIKSDEVAYKKQMKAEKQAKKEAKKAERLKAKAEQTKGKSANAEAYRGMTKLSSTLHSMVKGWTTMAHTLDAEVNRALKHAK